MYVWIFQPGNFTGLGSEEVKNATSTAKIIGGIEGGSVGAGGGGVRKQQRNKNKQKQVIKSQVKVLFTVRGQRILMFEEDLRERKKMKLNEPGRQKWTAVFWQCVKHAKLYLNQAAGLNFS